MMTATLVLDPERREPADPGASIPRLGPPPDLRSAARLRTKPRRGRKVRKPKQKRQSHQRGGWVALWGGMLSLVAWTAALLALVWVWFTHLEPATATERGQAAVEAPLTGPAIGSETSLSAFTDRPLFSASRRPPAAPAAPSGPDPEESLSRYQFQGTALFENDQVAFFWDQNRKMMLRLRAGEDLGGWTLSRIDARGVVLSYGQRRVTRTFES